MRVLSALISSFVFASAVLEHPKLFARAQVIRTGDQWAGVQKSVSNSLTDHFSSVGANFYVPEATGVVSNGAFVGVTLGNSAVRARECRARGVISAGVLIEITADGPTYTPATQVSPGNLMPITNSNNQHISIHSSDLMRVFIIYSGEASALAVFMDETQGWNLEVPLRATHKFCALRAQWQVATLKSGLSTYHLPRFGQVVFSGAQVCVNGFTFLGAGFHSTIENIERYGVLEVETRVFPHDWFLIEIQQRPVS